MANYIDLSGIIGLQRQFIGSAGATSNAAALSGLDLSLNSLSQALNAAGQSIGPTLTYQSEVQSILDRENSRLAAKKSTIDAAYKGQQRMVDLTNSETKKNQAYNLILIVAIITFFVVLGIKQVYDNGIIPNAVLDIMNIVILAGGMIYCVVLYTDAYKRSNMDFDQITLDDPTKKTQAELEAERLNKLANGNLSAATAGANAGCAGAACCPAGSTFNEFNTICVPNEAPFGTTGYVSGTWKPFIKGDKTLEWRNPATATTASLPGCGTADNYDPLKLACKPATTQGFETMNTSAGAQPYTPCEFSQYNVYNRCGSSTN
jgi:hypothetical protein